MAFPSNETLREVYGQAASDAASRLHELMVRHHERYADDDLEGLRFFSAPGRTEVIGNHTDHNGGKVLAASIAMDTVGAAVPNGTDVVSVTSEGYPTVIVHLSDLDAVPHCAGTVSLLAGMLRATRELGYEVGGFDATVSSEVIPAAGVSSSASFEMLVCAIVNSLFNEGAIDVADYARIGQYAENVYWEKASGLMDQMACAVGGTILMNFHDGVSYERLDFSYDQLGCDLVLVNTGKGHADLSAEYSSVPDEMHAVARVLGTEQLCQTDEPALLRRLDDVRATCGDRAVLRALHFFEECARVDEAADALSRGDAGRVLDLICQSGHSSWRWLQNAYVPTEASEQPIPMALALTELFLKEAGGAGACRLHGGGFAGVVMCACPKGLSADYVRLMSAHFGADNVYLTNIRAAGAVCLSK